MDDCQVSVLTPLGRGAVATVAVVGVEATARVAQRFRAAADKPLAEIPFGRIAFGRWATGPAAGEEVVVCRRDSGTMEIHGHGGRAAIRALVDSLVELGCREVSWQTVATKPGDELSNSVGHASNTSPTWATCSTNSARSLLAAEARLALAYARTERTAAILLDQWRGALCEALEAAENLMRQRQIAAAAAALQELAQRAALGLHLTQPWRVVLAGRPNVGKSSLINALLGYTRAIVYEEPGTTRDVLTAQTAVDGWPVELADTAGLRDSDDALEAAGIAAAHRQLLDADLVLLLFDRTQPWTAQDAALLRGWPSALLLHTKCDLMPGSPEDRPAGLPISSLTGQGVPRLLQNLAERLVPLPPPPGTAVPFTDRQIGLLGAARDALAGADADQALAILTALLSG
jgi:tRNA modification GTPase